MFNERRDEDWINPPEEKEDYEPDVDSIGDEEWLRQKEKEQQECDEYVCCKGDCK
jgi:hypothetical protein